MKKSYIFGIIVIAIAIGVIISSAGDASQYVSFKEAFAMAEAGDNSKVHVVGRLERTPSGDVVGINYDPVRDPNYLAFNMIDNNNEIRRVVCYNPPPSMQDFKRSEQVVVIGRVKDGQFIASEILMKCPSKYEDSQIKG
ncbi:MAG: cytochrome c maturation protein CcmE [Cytophagales bacterium]|nr:cytochrome c maturation protein CcmE [Bernardetiaceae bacterium]MDW8203916.1 cytochrome c maturation protein CcmE [Cytophagales bacterium]